ncbi:MAG: TraR/DksA family transcriptional regulator [Phaeodactylibacter sp.]|nr:TraR/DksA family transcriptional regulator [Phaeodactylibacter sp.]MCB9267396.1 TraR/DksA family transcriptional regulator [Lewinellaceae bacterium]MCB9288311.1 TraR/DksA family transcriptional regulator [Lewinellaceae bacterium]
MSNTVVRYSDGELAEFKALIEKKLANAQEQLNSLQEQILEITENTSDEHGGDWMDDSSINNDVEMLNNMAIRQRRYIKDLENALVRIRNKTYGICIITGELIDKKRLLAVPTTTKSLVAKTQEQNPTPERKSSSADRPTPKPTGEKKVITKIIRKSPSKPVAPRPEDFDDDDDDFNLGEFYDDTDDELDKSIANLDEFADESSDDDGDLGLDSTIEEDEDDDIDI